MKTLGIVAHSIEGASLCFVAAARHGGLTLGPFMHPTMVVSAIPMALSMPGWESGEHTEVARQLAEGVHMVAAAGADFYVCPDNTAHIVLEKIAGSLPIPGMHIAEVVCAEVARHNWKAVGLLGTKWTMTGPVYDRALNARGMTRLIPDARMRERLNDAIFGELCKGNFADDTTELFLTAVTELKRQGAECVVLGCTEIPLVINPENSPLPPVDSTRLLARQAVDLCANGAPLESRNGWLLL